MGPTESLRPSSSRVIAAAVATCCVLAVVVVLVSGATLAAALRAVGIAGLVTALAWALYWRPEVEVSDGGIRVVNPWRTVHVPWPALESVDERWSFAVRTTQGRRVSAFAAPARGLADRGPGVASRAASLVTERRAQLRSAGFLDDVRPEGAPVTVEFARGPLVAVAVALVLLGAGVLLPG